MKLEELLGVCRETFITQKIFKNTLSVQILSLDAKH